MPSATGASGYLVDLVRSTCTCPDYTTRRERCKHQHAVEYTLVWSQSTAPDGTVTETVVARRKTYRQDWPSYNAGQVAEKEHAERLLDALCDGVPQPPQGPGRPRLPLRDVVYGIVHKVFTTVSTRRAQSDLRACRARGLVVKAPAYNTVIEHMASPEITPILTAMIEESAAPLALIERNFAVDSTGFGTTLYRRWFDEKWGKEKSEQVWVKCHAMVGVTTNVVTSAAVSNAGDAPMLPPVLAATAQRFQVGDVVGDKAYASHRNVAAIHAAGGTPFLAFKEQGNVRVAIRVLRLRCDGWEPLARALRLEADSLSKILRGGRDVTAALAFRVAKLAEVTVDELMTGRFVPAGTCPHCGKRTAIDFGDEATVAE
ncbi:MAG TPA: transposase [Kofleriaceae bacterium]|nr:transposase [Kofleriaceae bacterium]